MHMYLDEVLVRARLEEARALAALEAARSAARPERQPLRVRAGLALIRLGRWLAGRAPAAQPGRAAA